MGRSPSPLGKRGKDRLVYLPADAVELVEDWLNLRGRMPGPLLCPVIKGGRVALRQLTPDAVYKILRRRAEQAGIEAFSPHDLRRTFCTDLLAAGIDVLTVQKLASHSSPVTTARYDRRGEETFASGGAAVKNSAPALMRGRESYSPHFLCCYPRKITRFLGVRPIPSREKGCGMTPINCQKQLSPSLLIARVCNRQNDAFDPC